jgi:hypothetical protein
MISSVLPEIQAPRFTRLLVKQVLAALTLVRVRLVNPVPVRSVLSRPRIRWSLEALGRPAVLTSELVGVVEPAEVPSIPCAPLPSTAVLAALI